MSHPLKLLQEIRLEQTHASTLNGYMTFSVTLVTRIDNPWLLLATLPLYHTVHDLKMTLLLSGAN